MNDLELAKEILNDFVSETPDLVEQLIQSIKKKDIYKITKAAHELKGSSATIGAQKLFIFSKEIEELAKKNNINQLYNSIQNLKNIANETLNEILKIGESI